MFWMTSPNRLKDMDRRGLMILRPISGPNDELLPRFDMVQPQCRDDLLQLTVVAWKTMSVETAAGIILVAV